MTEVSRACRKSAERVSNASAPSARRYMPWNML